MQNLKQIRKHQSIVIAFSSTSGGLEFGISVIVIYLEFVFWDFLFRITTVHIWEADVFLVRWNRLCYVEYGLVS